MTFNSTLTSYPQNSMRFGLLDLKPIEVSESFKKKGIMYKTTGIRFEPKVKIDTFEEYVNLENTNIFNTIKIPERFSIPELINDFSKISIDIYEHDNELKNEIANLKRADRGRPFLTFVQFMKERFESEREYYLEAEAKRFLESNFPLSFYNKFVVFNNTYYDFLKITHDVVRTHEFLASHSRSSMMYSKRISMMQHELGPLIEKFDECSFECSRLKKYVTIWNAESLEEISHPKFLDIEKMDYAQFQELSNQFNFKLREIRATLVKYDSNILQKTINLGDPTAKMFGRILTMPSGSLNSE